MESKRPYLVGIAGGSGSGKTTILKELFRRMPEGSLALVSQDNYYQPKEKQLIDENGEINFDLPESIDREHFYEDVKTLLSGNSITKTEYTFNNPGKEPGQIEVKTAPIIITEGLFIFHYDEINALLDHKVYVHAGEDVRLERRIRRDHQERGYPEKVVRYQWDNHVVPADRQFLQPYISDSDLVIDNDDHFQEHLDELVDHLYEVLNLTEK